MKKGKKWLAAILVAIMTISQAAYGQEIIPQTIESESEIADTADIIETETETEEVTEAVTETETETESETSNENSE